MPLGLRRSSVVISTVGIESALNVPVLIAGGWGAATAWPSANLAIFCPIVIPAPTRIRQLGWINGGTANNNVDVGIYRIDGVPLVTTGSTAQSGTNAVQTINITDLDLPPGRYYLAMACDGTTGLIVRAVPASAAMQSLGAFQQASAFPLPTPFTPATISNSYLPVILAISGRFV